MLILEEIDTVLTENLKNLGYNDDMANLLKKRISDRKARKRIGVWIKNMPLDGSSRNNMSMIISKIIEELDNEDIIEFSNKFGVLYELDMMDVNPDELSKSNIKKIYRKFTKMIKEIKTTDDLMSFANKMDKVLEGIVGRKYGNKLPYIHTPVKKQINSITIDGPLEPVIEILNRDPDFYDNIKHLKPKEAMKISKDELSSREIDKNRIVMEFNSGYFWYTLIGSECELEGDLMNHCGESTGTMYSLRDENNNPRVTLDYGRSRSIGKIFQIRSKGNSVPPKRYWDYIKSFIESEVPLSDRTLQDEGMEGSKSDMVSFLEFLEDNVKGMRTKKDKVKYGHLDPAKFLTSRLERLDYNRSYTNVLNIREFEEPEIEIIHMLDWDEFDGSYDDVPSGVTNREIKEAFEGNMEGYLKAIPDPFPENRFSVWESRELLDISVHENGVEVVWELYSGAFGANPKEYAFELLQEAKAYLSDESVDNTRDVLSEILRF